MQTGPMHFPRLPDWLIYLAITLALLIAPLGRRERIDAPAPPPPVPGQEAVAMAPVSPFAPAEVVAALGRRRTEVGTAFSVADTGVWLTARHVVADCANVALMVAEGRGVSARVEPGANNDVAVLVTEGGARALPLIGAARLQRGQRGFHPGFPRDAAGEATSRYLGRDELPARRRGERSQAALVWVETGRTTGLHGSLAGLSGAPALDAAGRVIGVTLAEQPRRGRIYTSTPEAIAEAMHSARVRPAAFAVGEPVTADNYYRVADSLRRDLRVAQVICLGG